VAGRSARAADASIGGGRMTSALHPHELPEAWRTEADRLRERYHDDVRANAWGTLADELEASLRAAELLPLTLTEAIAESGFSRSQLKRWMRDGTIPNSGTKARPLLLRANLPRKAGHGVVQRPALEVSFRRQVAHAVATGAMRA